MRHLAVIVVRFCCGVRGQWLKNQLLRLLTAKPETHEEEVIFEELKKSTRK